MSELNGVSGLLALNNIDRFTKIAIDSVLEQSRPLNELVIVVNGDNRNHIIKTINEWYVDHPEIILVDCALEQLSYALNLGITQCNYKYIARMDADDISHFTRIETQLNFIEKHNLDLVGCAINKINVDGEIIDAVSYPMGKKIASSLPFKNPFCHPSVMFKKSFIVKSKGYNAGFRSEDYDLWLRLKRQGVRWDNINTVLFSYRIHNSTAQRKPLAYAELCALMLRETLLNRSVMFFSGVFYNFFKFLWRSK